MPPNSREKVKRLVGLVENYEMSLKNLNFNTIIRFGAKQLPVFVAYVPLSPSLSYVRDEVQSTM